jgi:hypothetical protein
MMPRLHHPRPSARCLFVVMLALLTTVLGLLFVAPARKVVSTTHETITASTAGASELAAQRSGSRVIDRHRAREARSGRDGSPPIIHFLTANAPLDSIAPLPVRTALCPSTWIAWCSPSRARAELMVFLN